MVRDITDAPVLFCVEVNGMENNEYQGAVRFADGTESRFVSLLELMQLVQEKFETPMPAQESAGTE